MFSQNRTESRKRLFPLIPFFYIWGVQWVLSAVLEYAWPWESVGTAQTAAAAAALAASFAAGYRRAAGRPARNLRAGALLPAALPALVIVASMWLLIHVQAFDGGHLHLLLTLLLSLFFVQAGWAAGGEWIALGLSLLALSFLIALRYLGYAPLILGGFGGLSLIAAAVVLQLWKSKTPD